MAGGGTGGGKSRPGRAAGRVAAQAAPATLPPAAPETSPGLLLASLLLLLSLLLLPLLGGGYSGGGYEFSFVLLPLAGLCALLAGRELPRTAQLVLLLCLAGLLLLPFWLTPGQLLWYYLLQIPLGWCLSWIVLREAPSRGRLILPAVAAGALLTAVWGLFLWYGAGTLDYQISSSFGLHNPYGGYLLLAWPCAAVCAVQARGRAARVGWSLAALLLAAVLVLTHSQGCIAMLGLQLVLLLAFWLGGRFGRAGLPAEQLTAGAEATGGLDPPPAARPALSALALLGGLLLFGAILLAIPPVRQTLAHMLDFGGYSMQGRLRFWSAALEIFRAHLLTGGGPGSFAYVYPQYQRDWMYFSVDPHSWPLQLLAELGLPGLLILLAILAGLGLWLSRLWQRRGDMAAGLLAAAALGSLLHACIDFDYTFSAVTLLLGVVLAAGSWYARPEAAVEPASAPAAMPAPETAASLSTAFAPRPLLARWPAWLAAALLFGTAYWGQRLSLERFVLDAVRSSGEVAQLAEDESGAARALAHKEELLRSALRYDPHNFQNYYQLARQLSAGGPSYSEDALKLLERCLALNPRFAQGWALRGLLSREPDKREQYLDQALKLDPYNFPEHYYFYASSAGDDKSRLERLKLGMQRIPAEDPIPPDHVRPQWHALNPLFAQWWEQMAKLSSDPAEQKLYQARADKFHAYIVDEREKLLNQQQR